MDTMGEGYNGCCLAPFQSCKSIFHHTDIFVVFFSLLSAALALATDTRT